MPSGFGHISVRRGTREDAELGKQGKNRKLGFLYITPLDAYRAWSYLGTGEFRDEMEFRKHGENRRLGKIS
jgi:hypothetical protein